MSAPFLSPLLVSLQVRALVEAESLESAFVPEIGGVHVEHWSFTFLSKASGVEDVGDLLVPEVERLGSRYRTEETMVSLSVVHQEQVVAVRLGASQAERLGAALLVDLAIQIQERVLVVDALGERVR